jgi:hypothetical protein
MGTSNFPFGTSRQLSGLSRQLSGLSRQLSGLSRQLYVVLQALSGTPAERFKRPDEIQTDFEAEARKFDHVSTL